ncbi:MAG: gamma-glutamylcyclotransferase [Mesorhizobium sp.]
MWIFGYGSLMWDNWEQAFRCRKKVRAVAKDYARSFTKASVRNWGTKDAPGPTLRIVNRAGGECQGMAFEFAVDRSSDVLEYLRDREGGFSEETVELFLVGGETVLAKTFTYAGKNIIEGKNDEQIAEMVVRARGVDGSALDYVTACKRDLAAVGIEDPAVDSLWVSVNKILSKRENRS